MKFLSYFFFYVYISTVLLAGLWGAFGSPYIDHKVLFDLDANTLDEYSRINMLSQYRFLRALESGFGIFSLLFVKDIFHQKKFNHLFLIIMASGVAARIVSIFVDGMPSTLMLLFLGFEMIGVVVITVYTRKTILS